MSKRNSLVALLSVPCVIAFASLPLWRQAYAQVQKSDDLPAPAQASKETLLRLTGAQAKAAVLDGETFNAHVHDLSPGAPTDLARYRLRLIQHKASLTFAGVFELDGVPIPTSSFDVADSGDQSVTIDGDELKALIVVTQALRNPKLRSQYRFDYDITNYAVRVERDAAEIHVHCGTTIFRVFWPKVTYKAGSDYTELAYVGEDTSVSLQFDVSRKSNQIVKTLMLAD